GVNTKRRLRVHAANALTETAGAARSRHVPQGAAQRHDRHGVALTTTEERAGLIDDEPEAGQLGHAAGSYPIPHFLKSTRPRVRVCSGRAEGPTARQSAGLAVP